MSGAQFAGSLAVILLLAVLAIAYLTAWRERRLSQTLFDEQFRTDSYREPLSRRVKSPGKGAPGEGTDA